MKRHILTVGLLFLVLAPYYVSADLSLPEVLVSSENVMQADGLQVVVRNETNNISGNLGYLPLRFYRSQDGKDWIALVGISYKKTPGTYRLSIYVPGKDVYRKNIVVSKRDFKVVQLVITPDLSKKGYTDQKIISNTKIENGELGKAMNSFTPTIYSSKPFTYPLQEIKITGGYGEIRKSKNYSIRHLGVDLKAPLGTSVFAINDGKVVLKDTFTDYGNTVVVDHGLGVYSLYLHLSSFNVELNQIVKQGDVIGNAGDTGYAVGSHLHLSVRVRGASLDPLKFIEASQWKQ